MLEELLFMILRGVIIGVVVSAPMGPVGIFCIQRTLDKGRQSGFYTGVGAAISDLIYCILTGFCLSFIEGFINDHRSPIQIIGASVLIGFGIWLIKKKPDSTVSADADQGSPSVEGDILKGFALTFSNPLILFLIIGLFAQFNFVIEGMTFWHYVLGFIGIIAGALGWWWVVTYFVDKIRCHFTRRTMKLINTVVGVIILIFAAVGIVSATSAYAQGAEKAPRMKSTVSFRVADKSMKGWQAEVADSLGSGFRMEVAPGSKSDPFGDSVSDGLVIGVFDLLTGVRLGGAELNDNIDPYRGSNSWRLIRDGHTWRLYAGNRDYGFRCSFDVAMGASLEPAIASAKGGEIEIDMMEMSADRCFEEESVEDDIFGRLAACGERKTGLPGIYSLYDYDHDDSYASMGGQYRIAMLPAEEEGDYDIVYMSGARVLGDIWKEGMRKGLLKASPFSNVFDVEWVDAEGSVMRHDVQADFDPLTQLVTIRFPYQNATLRFRKEP